MLQKVAKNKNNFYLCCMTLKEAFQQLTDSSEFKEIAKQKTPLGSKYRVYLNRFRAGELKSGAIAELLLANGYEIKASKARKRKNY